MSARAKLVAKIRNNPKDVRFRDACLVAEWIGFKHTSGKGSHRAFARTGERTQLNFQDRNGLISPYQARQLIDMLDLYWNDDE
jgi:hypothetical protein